MIKIQAFQRNGIKTKECVEEFEFCCWEQLNKWLDSFAGLNKCPKCKEKAGISANQMAIDGITAVQEELKFPDQRNTKRWYELEDIKKKLK